MRNMQRELEELREAREQEVFQAREDREELVMLRDRCNKLEDELESRQGMVRSLSIDGPSTSNIVYVEG